jgi:hypothetical protein
MPRPRLLAVSDAVGRGVTAALTGLAAVRRGKALHPHGAVHRATLRIHGDPIAPGLLGTPGEHVAVVRFSRAVGLPRPLPDLLGLAIRVLDAGGPGCDQDLLLTTTVRRRILSPARDVQDRPYSSVLPYRAPSAPPFLIGALPRGDAPRPDGADELDRLARAAATGALRFDLAVAPLHGPFRAVGELHVGARLGPELDPLRFDPFLTGAGLVPTGAINRWRRAAYRRSQRAWRRTQPAGAHDQEAGDAALAVLRRTGREGGATPPAVG